MIMESKKEIYIIKRENGFIEYAKETFIVAEKVINETLESGEKEVENFENQIQSLMAQTELLKMQLATKEETLKDFRTIRELTKEKETALAQVETESKGL